MQTDSQVDDAGELVNPSRRSALFRGGIAASAAVLVSTLTPARAAIPGRTETEPNELDGKPVPEPPDTISSGPIRANRGSMLNGKTVVVTGAARGIGRAIAVEMAVNGADVAIIDIAGFVSPASNAKPAKPEDLDETLRQIKATGRRGVAIRADIRDIGALRKSADEIEQQFGKIDVVVANAAIQRWVPLLEMQDADWRDVIDNNLNGTANTLRAFAPKMVARKRGRIIVLSSMQGKHGTKDAASYSASKWGILGLMKSASLEWGTYGITVNALIPGLVDTALTRYETRLKESMAENGQKTARSSDTTRSMGQSRADRSSQGGLAAAGRHFADGCVPGFRRGGDDHRRRIRSHRRRQCEGHLVTL